MRVQTAHGSVSQDACLYLLVGYAVPQSARNIPSVEVQFIVLYCIVFVYITNG